MRPYLAFKVYCTYFFLPIVAEKIRCFFVSFYPVDDLHASLRDDCLLSGADARGAVAELGDSTAVEEELENCTQK